MRSPEEYARIKQYEHVVAGNSPLICVGESGGSYNFQFKDKVYPCDEQFIPVANPFGSIDHLLNPNYQRVKNNRSLFTRKSSHRKKV